MNCEEAREVIYAGVDEPMSSGSEKKLDEHLRGCERCRAEFRELNRLEEVLRSVPEPPVPRARLRETANAVSLEVRARGRANAAYQRVGVWVAVAAAVVIAVGVGLVAGLRLAPATKETPASRRGESVARKTGVSPVPESGAYEVGVSPEDGAPQQSDLLVEKLVQADLALSETDAPGQRAAILCAMSRDVLSALEDSVDRRDIEEVQALGQGYTKLVRDGVLPNVKLASEEKDREGVTEVADSLERNREVLGLLVAKAKGHERTLLAEALKASEECLNAAEGEAGVF